MVDVDVGVVASVAIAFEYEMCRDVVVALVVVSSEAVGCW